MINNSATPFHNDVGIYTDLLVSKERGNSQRIEEGQTVCESITSIFKKKNCRR